LVNIAQRLIEAVLFFHPAVWFVSRRIRAERELCCDDMVIAAGGQPLVYATSLVQMAEMSLASQPTGWFQTAALGAADRSSQLRLRVLRLLDSPGADGFRLARASTLMLSVAGLLAIGVAFCLGSPAKARKDAAEAQSPAATVKQTERMEKLPGTMFTPDEVAAHYEKLYGAKKTPAELAKFYSDQAIRYASGGGEPVEMASARFGGPVEFDKDTSVTLNAGENKAFGYAFQARSVKFTRRGEEVWASLRFDLQTTAEGTWRIRVALLSPDGQQMGSGETSLTTSLAIRRVPMRRPNQYLHSPLGHWNDVSKATKFRIAIARAPDGAPVTAKRTDEPPLSKSPEPTWGEAVEGVQCRLTADKPVWNAGEIPTFKAEVRNQGTRNLSIAQAQQLCEIEFDGRWFVWLGPIDVKSSALDPGRQYTNIPITLVSDWRSKDAREPLKLAPGKHTVRIAFIASPQNRNVSPPVRAVSNPVAIEIRGQAAEAGTFVEMVAGTTGASRVDLSEAAFQKKVSLSFKDAPLEDVIRFLAREANLNIVMRPEQMRGAIVAEMKEVSVGEALRSILRAHGLELLRDSDGVCRITARK
jgi:hypothetical protein